MISGKKKFLTKLIPVAIIVLFKCSDNLSANTQFVIRESTLNSTLKQRGIRAVLYEPSGYLWLLTSTSALNYDGSTLKVYEHYIDKHGNSQPLAPLDLEKDSKGNIFITSKTGAIVFYQDNKADFTEITLFGDTVPPDATPEDIVADSENSLWISYKEHGLYQLHRINALNYRSTKIISEQIDDTQLIDDNHILVLTRNGELREIKLNPFSNTLVLDIRHCLKQQLVALNFLYLPDIHQYWIGTNAGLYTFGSNNEHCARIRLNHSKKSSRTAVIVHTLFRSDVDKLIWAGTDEGLFSISTDKASRHYDTVNSGLSDSWVTAITDSSQNYLFIGTYNGLNIGYHSNFEYFSKHENSDLSSVVAISGSYADHDLWIGTYQGLLKFSADFSSKDSSFEVNPLGTSNTGIMCLHTNPDSLWVGYRNSGVERIDLETGKVSRYTASTADALSSNSVTVISELSRTGILVGTHGGGLNLIHKDGSIDIYQRGDDEGNNNITDTLSFNSHYLLVGTEYGINLLNVRTGTYQRLRIRLQDRQGEPPPFILSMESDKTGRIWLGTEANGLLKTELTTDRENSPVLNIKESFFEGASIYAIEVDDSGDVWVSSDNTISRIEPDSSKVENFENVSGILDGEFDFGVSFKDNRGRLYFGGSNGYTRFDPSLAKIDRTPSDVILTDLNVGGLQPRSGRALRKLKSLILTPEDYFVRFTFSTLDFLDPGNNQYKYKLVGFDPDWIENGTNNSITYTNLPTGQYTLRVQGANSRGVWNESGLSIDVTVLPPYWRTWWAYTLYMVTIVALLYFFRRLYDGYIIKAKVEKRAEEMTHVAHTAMDDMQDQMDIQDRLIESMHHNHLHSLQCIRADLTRLANSPEPVVRKPVLKRVSNALLRHTSLEESLFYREDELCIDLRKYTDILTTKMSNAEPDCWDCITVINAIDAVVVSVDFGTIVTELIFECLNYAAREVSYSSQGAHFYITIGMNHRGGAGGYEFRFLTSELSHSANPAEENRLFLDSISEIADRLGAQNNLHMDSGSLHLLIPSPQAD